MVTACLFFRREEILPPAKSRRHLTLLVVFEFLKTLGLAGGKAYFYILGIMGIDYAGQAATFLASQEYGITMSMKPVRHGKFGLYG